MSTHTNAATHSAAWTVQSWVSFLLSLGVTAIGIWALPVDLWVKGFMAMGLVFTVGSSITLAKTVRDQHESERLTKRIDEARVSKLIAEHDPLQPGF
ncbi:MAG TPA: YiaA/YiaB family inner membrane protein [Myxococcaceae bacterium]